MRQRGSGVVLAREATNPSSPARDPADPERSHSKSKNAKRDSIGFRFLWSWGTRYGLQ